MTVRDLTSDDAVFEPEIDDQDVEVTRHPSSQAFVIFGGTGDLARRKILPALARLAEKGALPDDFIVIGVARSPMSDDDFRRICLEAAPIDGSDEWEKRVARFSYLAIDDHATVLYAPLAARLAQLDETLGTLGNRVFYLAIPPDQFAKVVRGLGEAGLNTPGKGGEFCRLVIEKPFGVDTESSVALSDEVHAYFNEEQIFRIDHYMGKETVQNILAFRFANAIFEPIWNRRYVDHVEVLVAESIGIEGRGEFYEHAGALRDIVQNHVMQVLALTLMEPPSAVEGNVIRDEKVKLLRSVDVVDDKEALNQVVRGQYGAGFIDSERVVAYRDEPGVDPKSETETYVAMRLDVDNWRWAGVPVFVRTGKRLHERKTEVVLVFQRPPHLPFQGKLARDLRPDSLTLRIQPDDGIMLCFGAKVPGPTFRVRNVSMNFLYSQAFPGETVDAYDRLLLDAMVGDPTLFIRDDEVHRAWEIVAPFQRVFAEDAAPLAPYRAGSWGPEEADQLIEASGRRWRTV
jgi:glucose-6-phosphate 1-dehydrogenase